MIYPYQDKTPVVDESCFIAPGSMIIGDVVLAEEVSIWYNAVVRGDVHYIRIGRRSNIQDNATVHADSGIATGPGGNPTIIGEDVTIGHNCIIHACTIEDACLIGMGATVLDGAVVGRGSVIGAGAVVLKNTVIPPYSVAVGAPAKVIKTMPPESEEERHTQAYHYAWLANENRQSIQK